MKKIKKCYTATHDESNINKYMILLKSVLLCFLISFIGIILYALVLSFTSVSDSSMSGITQTIIIISIAISSIYCGKKLKKKGWLYGFIIGLIFILALIPISILFGQHFEVDKYLIAKILLGSIVGIIGGIIGVNLN